MYICIRVTHFHGDQDRRARLSRYPFLSGERRSRRGRVGIDVRLKKRRLARHDDRDGLAGGLRGVELIEAIDLALSRIQAALGHEAEPALRKAGDVLTNIIAPGRLVCYFVISDASVAFAGHVNHLRVVVIKGKEHARRRVNVLLTQRL